MVVPPTIPPVQELAIASFSAQELASGTGIVLFYAFRGDNPSGDVDGLTEFTFSSEPIETQVNDTTVEFTFTSPVFNLPRYVKGTAYVNVPLWQASGSARFTAKLQHWDGSTPTDLTGTATSNSLSGTPKVGTPLVELPITTEKMVKKGEMIRAIITIITTADGYFGHSPDNKTGTRNTQGTKLTVGVPFRSGL